MMLMRLSKIVWLAVLILSSTAQSATYYVSTTGNDANDGLSERSAWRTISHAAKVAKAGDTVLVLPGDYGDERVVFANSGEKGKPIVFKGHKGRPRLKSADPKAVAFLAEGKSYIHIEGFDIIGYGSAVVLTYCAFCRVRDLRCLGRGGAIVLRDGTDYCWVDRCYVEDTYWNGIMVYGDSYYRLRPCSFNVISNCTVVRGGHSSIDVHTCCPDTYVVGCVVRERGKDRRGRTATCGLYFHNHHIDRLHSIGNIAYDVHWGMFLGGGVNCVIADNLLFNVSKGIDLDYERIRVKGSRGLERVDAPCDGNIIAENIIFNVSKAPPIWMCGARHNLICRNYADGGQSLPDYECHRCAGVEPIGNRIVDPMRGGERISVREGYFTVSLSPGFGPRGIGYRLRGTGGAHQILGGREIFFGKLTKGRFTLEPVSVASEFPAPQDLRVVALPEGGAVIVWRDCYSDEEGFVLERDLGSGYEAIAKLQANVTRYIDREVGMRKARYRVFAIRAGRRSPYSNEDEIVRGYWLTDRTGLDVDGYAAFALIEGDMWKTLIVEDVRSVSHRGEVWLEASKPVTAMLRFRVNCVRGAVEGEGDYELRLGVGAGRIESASFNGSAVRASSKSGLLTLALHGSGRLEVRMRER